MIIKSMSRKQPSFHQLIDYIEKGAKDKHFAVYHNTYTRDTERLKAEFKRNAEHLKARKNGVFLYHEIFSITRSKNLDENTQKARLQQIVREYLQMRAGKNLAYGLLHEDKNNNFHFHIVISANEIDSQDRHRLSKSDFAQIQIQLERLVLQRYPELEQQAVFDENQTTEQKRKREQQSRISHQGAELQRRTGATPKRDEMKATLEKIFQEATDGRHFSELLEAHRLKLYQRGKNYGITAEDGRKYRFATLGLTEAWEILDKRMMAVFERQKYQAQHSPEPTRQKTERVAPEAQQQPADRTEQSITREQANEQPSQAPPRHQASPSMKDPFERKPFVFEKELETIILGEEAEQKTNEPQATADPMEDEVKKRIREMEAIRKARAEREQQHQNKDQYQDQER